MLRPPPWAVEELAPPDVNVWRCLEARRDKPSAPGRGILPTRGKSRAAAGGEETHEASAFKSPTHCHRPEGTQRMGAGLVSPDPPALGRKGQAAPTSEQVVPGPLSPEMLHSVEVFLPVVEVVLEGAVAVITEVPLPHLSSSRAASAPPGSHQTSSPWGRRRTCRRIRDLQRLLPKENNSSHLGLAGGGGGETRQHIPLPIRGRQGSTRCVCAGEAGSRLPLPPPWLCRATSPCRGTGGLSPQRPREPGAPRAGKAAAGATQLRRPRPPQQPGPRIPARGHKSRHRREEGTSPCPALRGEAETEGCRGDGRPAEPARAAGGLPGVPCSQGCPPHPPQPRAARCPCSAKRSTRRSRALGRSGEPGPAGAASSLLVKSWHLINAKDG